MHKKLLTILVFIATIIVLSAQTPELLNYQGVLKNPDGSIRPNAEAVLTLEFVQDGTTTYQESHHITTNANGYFAIYPGSGNALLGNFSEIDWSTGPVVMRSILDNVTIAETHLTSVPYALYAQRVKGQDNMEFRIDTISDLLYQTTLLVDNNIVEIDNLHGDVDSLYLTVAGIIEQDSISALHTQAQIDSLHADVDTLHTNINSLADSIAAQTRFFNATAYAPPPAGTYHTCSSASAAVPQPIRNMGLVVTFRSDTLNWQSIQYIHNDTTQWLNSELWKSYSTYGNIILPYAESDSTTRLQIPVNHRQQGLIISYFNNNHVVNEQFIAGKYDDYTWSNDSSWMQLLLNSSELDKMRAEIARIDTLVNDVKKGFQDMSTFGAWFYINRNELFSQCGGINNNGEEVESLLMLHTPLVPINNQWFVTTVGNQEFPGISFYRDYDMSSRLTSICDTLTSDEWQSQTFDFSTDEIPRSAKFFTVNYLLSTQDSTSIRLRNPIEDVIDTSIKYNYSELTNNFNYIGAYVGCNGERRINAKMRHSRFIPLGDDVYKIITTGSYNEDAICPVIVYYDNDYFDSCVGYDIGDVQEGGTTTCERIISRENVPEGTTHFVVNWIPSQGGSSIYIGKTTEDAIIETDNRLVNLESNISCYTGGKLVTIGDSFTTNSGNRGPKWQELLCSWLGTTWSEDETEKGVNGFSPMGVGGSWVMPNDINAMSIRCADVRRYSPDMIIVYGGQNDKIDKYSLGDINDTPFIPSQTIDFTNRSNINSLAEAIDYITNYEVNIIDNTLMHINTSSGKQLYYLESKDSCQVEEAWIHPIDSISFYSAYKGMIEQLCTRNPKATIFCLTLLQCNSESYDGSLGTWEELDAQRRIKCEAIKEIAAYYGVEVIDLWNKSGITPYNISTYYNDWLHPNQHGYRRMAECIYRIIK